MLIGILIGLSPVILFLAVYAYIGIADAVVRRRNARDTDYRRAQRIADAHARLGDRVRAAR